MSPQCNNSPDAFVDARGLRCPEPLMVVRNRMMDMSSGEIVEVCATDPSTRWDFRNFCNFLGHELLLSDESGEGQSLQYRYWIRKK